jgi:hypothetical protein
MIITLSLASVPSKIRRERGLARDFEGLGLLAPVLSFNPLVEESKESYARIKFSSCSFGRALRCGVKNEENSLRTKLKQKQNGKTSQKRTLKIAILQDGHFDVFLSSAVIQFLFSR